jgi:predicted PurR-regulated permease PerM
VHLPGFAIVVSLLCWEHLLGFVGLFVSFPFLFVASKIRGEMKKSEEPSS